MDAVAAADDVQDDSEVLSGPVREVADGCAAGPGARQSSEVILYCGRQRRRHLQRSDGTRDREDRRAGLALLLQQVGRRHRA